MRRTRAWVSGTWALLAVALGTVPAAGQTTPPVPLEISLPTDNEALFRGDGPAFYQRTNRSVKPGFEPPWMGGKYGFVRNGMQTRWGILYLRFHEGIDIRPLRRNRNGEPLDEVRSPADGTVVHASNVSRHSSYGRYVVIEHWWRGSPFYTLLAHLNTVDVAVGQEVRRGDRIGLLGYTGVGINRTRAHVHFEINLLLNQNFQQCYAKHFPSEQNRHGIFNGLNLAGADVAELFLKLEEDPSYSVRELVQDTPGFFAVTVPANGMLDILWRYPWLSPQLKNWLPEFGVPGDLAASWEITFTRAGLPVRIDALSHEVSGRSVRILESTNVPYRYETRGLVGGSGNSPSLTNQGHRLVDFVTCPPPLPTSIAW